MVEWEDSIETDCLPLRGEWSIFPTLKISSYFSNVCCDQLDNIFVVLYLNCK